MLTLQFTISECERSMSCLRIFKNYLRSTMKSERFNGLILMKLQDQMMKKFAFFYLKSFVLLSSFWKAEIYACKTC